MQAILTAGGEVVATIRRIDGTFIMDLGDDQPDLDRATLDQADLAGIQAEGLICSDASFRGANLAGADLYWIMALDTVFDDANMRGASVRGGSLNGASFVGTDLTDADLSEDNLGRGTDLCGANLGSAVVLRTRFHGARYNRETIFPPGFDPALHSMVRDESSE